MEISFYERCTELLRRHDRFGRGAKAVNAAVTALMYLQYLCLLAALAAFSKGGELLLLIGVTGSGFVLVTVLRRALAAPRPFEVYGFEPYLGRHRPHRSFPSRHAYSATVIAAATVWVASLLGGSWLFGLVVWLMAVYVMLFRVVGGVHFIRDVLAGAALGVLFGAVGFWLIPWLFL